jgi:hypothetical protein
MGLFAAIGFVLLVGVASLVWVQQAAKRETVAAVVTLNPTGSAGRALLVFHPGLSDFPDRIVTAFADGLLQSGWRIDRTTASRQAPADAKAYDLIVLGSPVYASAAAMPPQDYIARVGDFHGKPVVCSPLRAMLQAHWREADDQRSTGSTIPSFVVMAVFPTPEMSAVGLTCRGKQSVDLDQRLS